MTEKDFKKESYWKFVEEFVTELKTAKYWFKNDGSPLPEWKLFENRDAARGAAWDAARGAAWDAAWDAARGAARDAAYDAARGAALFARLLVCIGLEVDIKHLVHVNARMQVWRKGYGLLCDVNGILYVYKQP